MNNQNNNQTRREVERRMLPYLIEFVKFATGFVAILTIALLALHSTQAAMLH